MQMSADVYRIQQYLRERQAREDEEAARKAGKKEVADRIYERLKGQAEAEAAAREEEDRLINLLHAEEGAERARRSAIIRGAVCPANVSQCAAAICNVLLLSKKFNHGAKRNVLAGEIALVRAALHWSKHSLLPITLCRTKNHIRSPINTKLRILSLSCFSLPDRHGPSACAQLR